MQYPIRVLYYEVNPDFPNSRESALDHLCAFNSDLPQYAQDRNTVVPHHSNVSRLSPAIRHRLISEKEVADYALQEHGFKKTEKFVQEVYWRRYWKGWLALRPCVWNSYLSDLRDITSLPEEAEALMRGEGDVDIMNYFVQELRETGYLHNHARMWFSAYWVHSLKLPWQLGADFFYRHLLDGDPASNTLSWRGVAGLQTKGKTYLARKSNILKFTHPDLIAGRAGGLELLENGEALTPTEAEFNTANEEWKMPEFPTPVLDHAQAVGMWIHEEHLTTDLAYREEYQPSCFLLTL